MWLRQTQTSVLRQDPLGNLTLRSEFPAGWGGRWARWSAECRVQGAAGSGPDVTRPAHPPLVVPRSPSGSWESHLARPGPALSSPPRQLGRAGVMSCF